MSHYGCIHDRLALQTLSLSHSLSLQKCTTLLRIKYSSTKKSRIHQGTFTTDAIGFHWQIHSTIEYLITSTRSFWLLLSNSPAHTHTHTHTQTHMLTCAKNNNIGFLVLPQCPVPLITRICVCKCLEKFNMPTTQIPSVIISVCGDSTSQTNSNKRSQCFYHFGWC